NNTIEAMLVSDFVCKNNIPSIAHIHDMKESFTGFYKKNIIAKSLKKYDRLITVSSATQRSWNDLDFNVVYNGLDNEYFNIHNKQYRSIKKIGFIGSLNKRKGIDILIKNLNKIIKNNYEVNIVTTDITSKYYNTLKKNENIKIFTNLNYKEVRNFMKTIDLLIVPSRFDPLPTVIMEAMAVGTIVIGNNIDSIKEMLDDTKLLYDNDSIYEKIEEISGMNNSMLNNLSIKLKNRSNKKFKDSTKKDKINYIIKNLLKIEDKNYLV
ncbi:glycosyltransferase family 4 protein, partial [Clostridium botulinum]|nr:glycosyltransferase family 4 protein [Clostridium botulinum]